MEMDRGTNILAPSKTNASATGMLTGRGAEYFPSVLFVVLAEERVAVLEAVVKRMSAEAR